MSFVESIRTCFSKYADFSGRAGRPEFWWFVLFTIVAGMAFSIGGNLADSLWTLVTLVPSIAVGARRLHDTHRSGWWQLLGLIPVVGWIVLIVFLAQPTKAGVPKLGAMAGAG